MDGVKIPFLDTVKFLGVTLDKKINWKTLIDNKTAVCKKLMDMIKSNLRGMQASKCVQTQQNPTYNTGHKICTQ